MCRFSFPRNTVRIHISMSGSQFMCLSLFHYLTDRTELGHFERRLFVRMLVYLIGTLFRDQFTNIMNECALVNYKGADVRILDVFSYFMHYFNNIQRLYSQTGCSRANSVALLRCNVTCQQTATCQTDCDLFRATC